MVRVHAALFPYSRMENMKKGEIKLYEKKEKKKTHEDYYKNSFI